MEFFTDDKCWVDVTISGQPVALGIDPIADDLPPLS